MEKLSKIGVGEAAIIHSFESDEIFLKLMEMGCVPGEMVVVEQIAPMKDPISILIAGYKLSLRLEEAEKIWVKRL
ncbi:MAG: ferrous iron transport protein A [Sphingobacteriales bacterium]|nr:ferrous iron transport protein A [Sphingobacteriales bacterium]